MLFYLYISCVLYTYIHTHTLHIDICEDRHINASSLIRSEVGQVKSTTPVSAHIKRSKYYFPAAKPIYFSASSSSIFCSGFGLDLFRTWALKVGIARRKNHSDFSDFRSKILVPEYFLAFDIALLLDSGSGADSTYSKRPHVWKVRVRPPFLSGALLVYVS